MGKILVLYCSKTGNTEKMAELVAEGAGSVEGMEVRTRTPETAETADLEWCDGIAPLHVDSRGVAGNASFLVEGVLDLPGDDDARLAAQPGLFICLEAPHRGVGRFATGQRDVNSPGLFLGEELLPFRASDDDSGRARSALDPVGRVGVGVGM